MIILQTLHWVQFAGTEKVCVDLCNELSKEHTVYLLTNEKIKSYINDDVNFVNLDFEKNRYGDILSDEITKDYFILNKTIRYLR